MMPHEANLLAFDGHRRDVAAGCGVSPTLVDGWTRLPKAAGGDGENSPTQRVVETTLALRAAGSNRSEVLFLYLADELGYVTPVRTTDVPACVCLTDAGDALRSVSGYLDAFTLANADGVITVAEAERLIDACQVVVATFSRQECALHARVIDGEELSLRRRIGPKRALPRLVSLRKAVTA